MIIKSYAKINLSLNITDKTSNNYHTLNSVFAFLNIFDEIKIEKSNQYQLIINSNQILSNQKNNLITKTINLLKANFKNVHDNLKIILNKNIPISAGLGGGSSNAGVILLALNKIFNLKLTKQQLIDLAIQIGSDVPFFTQNQAALVTNIGDKITPINDLFTNPINCIVINPKIHLATKDVFENFNLNHSNKLSYENQNLDDFLKTATNDLTISACQLSSKITEILDFLKNLNQVKYWQMSGSGSTCYALFNSNVNLEEKYQEIKKQFPDYLILKTQILNKIGYLKTLNR